MTDTPKNVVFIGQLDEGKWAAYHEHEPLFCVITDTEDEAKQFVAVALRDYYSRFRRFDGEFKSREVDGLPPAHVIATSKAYEFEGAA